MLERPNHDSGQTKDFVDMGLDQVPASYDETPKKVWPNDDFIKSIEELQMFFEQYHGTHSER